MVFRLPISKKSTQLIIQKVEWYIIYFRVNDFHIIIIMFKLPTVILNWETDSFFNRSNRFKISRK